MKTKISLFAMFVAIIDIEISQVEAYSTGAIPTSRCEDMTPQHGSPPNPTNLNPYSLYVPFLTYLPGKNVELTLREKEPDNPPPFVGYYVQGRTLEGEQPIGQFNILNASLSRTHSCSSNVPDTSGIGNTLSHTTQWHLNPEPRLTVKWTAPFSNSNLYFRGTFVQSFSSFWVGTSSLALSPLHRMNVTECCRKESQISPSMMSICEQLEDENFFFDSAFQDSVNEILNNETERHGFFLVLRCLHWSASSTSIKRSNLHDCCAVEGVSDQCLIFCDGETYATWDRYQAFFQSFHNCSMNNVALLPCQLSENKDSSTTATPYETTEDYIDSPTTENPSGSCESGFTSSEFGCIDIDECATDTCGVGGSCANTPGSFSCFCFEGYTGEGFACSDINECEENPCASGGSCINLIGSFSCFCLFGYTGDGFTCIDENEDSSSTATPYETTEDYVDSPTTENPFNCFSTVTDASGCSCENGFTSSEIGCVDIDECFGTIDNCSPQADCSNTLGSFVCTCKAGWSGDGITCTEDYIDFPTAENPSNCFSTVTDASGYSCENAFTASEFGCIDIDECATDTCSVGGSCTNTPGSFSCFCFEGYTGEGFACSDINECEENPCASGGSCINLIGSFSCFCLFGYTGDGFTCTDENEDSSSTATPYETTEDYVDSPTTEILFNCFSTVTDASGCSCENGFTSSEIGCVDIDECFGTIDNCSPQADCSNTLGSFVCTCKAGWSGDGITCTDIDECATDTCSVGGSCTNTPGSFSCFCFEGYTGEGFACSDIDECFGLIDNCSPQADCSNTLGSFVCTCKAGWSGDGITCTALQPETTESPTISTTSPFQLQNNSILYSIITTINFTPTSDRQKTSINDELELNLLAPALGTLDGYQRVRFVSGTIGSFIIASETEFLATDTGSDFVIPTLSMIESSLNERALALNYSLPGPTTKVVSVGVSPEFEVTRQATNGLCNEETACPAPPVGYTTSCVEVGLSSVHCFCTLADSEEELNCPTVTPPPAESLSIGAIVGIAIGGIALLIVLIFVVVCCKRRQNVQSSNRTQKPGSLPVYHDYVDPASLNTKKTDGIADDTGDAVYMEIHPKEDSLYTKDGEYLDMNEMFQTTKNDGNDAMKTQQQSKILEEDLGYETPLKQQPALPGNHPSHAVVNSYVKLGGKKENNSLESESIKTKPVLSMEETSDGYLVSTQHNATEKLESESKTTEITIQPDNISGVYAEPDNEHAKDKSEVAEQGDLPSASAIDNYEVVVYQKHETADPAKEVVATECIVIEENKSIPSDPTATENDNVVTAAHAAKDGFAQEPDSDHCNKIPTEVKM